MKQVVEIAVWITVVLGYWWAASRPSDMPPWLVTALGMALTVLATGKVAVHWNEFWKGRSQGE